MAESPLERAKKAKADEYYTQIVDIESEMNAYVAYDRDVFRGKTVLCPCDDPEDSYFTLFFAQKFSELGLRKLISTSYAPTAKQDRYGIPIPQGCKYDPTRGRILVVDHDVNGDGTVDFKDLEWGYLEGDGDFRSDEVKRLRDEADVIVTNPPFSMFREYFAWLMEADKKFIYICNKNCVTYKEVFPHIKDNKVWLGATPQSRDLLFRIPSFTVERFLKDELSKKGSKYKVVDGKIYGRSPAVWMTNMEHGRRHQPLQLMTMADNIRFSKHKEIRETGYLKYVNYDAIDVPFTDAIPCDFTGVMGVPISFLDKYCPEQFEIIGISLELADMKPIKERLGKLNGGPRLYTEEKGNLIRQYERILIRLKKAIEKGGQR